MNQLIEEDVEKLNTIVDRWGGKPSFLIEILQDIQEEYHYLPKEVLMTTAQHLKVPLNQVFHIATFFKGLSLEPRGKHLIQVCMGTACHVQGAPRVLETIERDLKVKAGNTTEDKKFALEGVRCLGCCGLAAVVTVDKDLYGQVKLSKVEKIINKYD